MSVMEKGLKRAHAWKYVFPISMFMKTKLLNTITAKLEISYLGYIHSVIWM